MVTTPSQTVLSPFRFFHPVLSRPLEKFAPDTSLHFHTDIFTALGIGAGALPGRWGAAGCACLPQVSGNLCELFTAALLSQRTDELLSLRRRYT